MAMVEAAEGNFDAAGKRFEVALEISNRANGDDPETDFTLDLVMGPIMRCNPCQYSTARSR